MSSGIRKCLLRRWPDFKGYGFNLHAEKGKPGQYVGLVDEGSPALAAGLKEGDRIVEVNGSSIAGESHRQVVDRIKEGTDSVWLLVVDKETEEFCKNNNLTISEDSSDVSICESPEFNPYTAKATAEEPKEAVPAAGENPSGEAENDYESSTSSEPPTAVASAPKLLSENLPEPPIESEANTTVESVEPCHKDEELPPPPPELSETVEESSSPADKADPAETTPAETTPAETAPAETTPAETAPVETAPAETVAAETVAAAPEMSVEKYDDEPELRAGGDGAQTAVAEPAAAEPVTKSIPEPTPAPQKQVEPAKSNGTQQATSDVDSMKKMSAAEMREALKKQKKNDPRNQKLSAKDKLAMFQRL